MRKDNSGFSLVELIVVIAIAGVLMTGFGYGYGLMSTKAAEVCANRLLSILQSHRTTAMGKMDSYVEIYIDGEGDVCVKEYVKDYDGTEIDYGVEKIADSTVDVKFRLLDDPEGTYRDLVSGGEALKLSFNRSTGAFNDLSKMGSAYEGKYCAKIKISKAGKDKILKLSYLTGKVASE